MITRSRCLLVWAALTAMTAGTARWAWASVTASARFDELVVSLAGLALVGCAVWAWGVGTVVVAQALRGPAAAPRPTRGVPRWISRAVLAACGVAAVAAAPAQASSYDGPLLPELHTQQADAATMDGLPFPDRAVGPAGAPRAPRPAATTTTSEAIDTVVVQAGDSLWSIAEDLLGPDATDAEVAATTRSLVDLNRAAVGADPDLIHPGLRLRTPGA